MTQRLLCLSLIAMAALATLANAQEKRQPIEECASDIPIEIGINFTRKGHEETLSKEMAHIYPVIQNKLNDEAILERWDGVKGTAEEHLEWMLAHARKHTDLDLDGFRALGEREGIQYEINDELTKKAGGAGYMRLSGEVDIPAELLVALVMDSGSLGELDDTVMFLNMLHQYKNKRSAICIWVAAPGFPFLWRDGLDLTSWKRDEDGTYWQYSISVPEEIPHFKTGSLRAVDRYWAYKLSPVDGGKRTKLVLICQTDLGGWMPNALVNYMVGSVLADYIHRVERLAKGLTPSALERLVEGIRSNE